MSLDLAAIFGAGLLTFVTPCVLPLVPFYLAALVGGDPRRVGTQERGQLLVRALFFCVGFVTVFILMGLVASSVGALLSAHRVTFQTVGAVVILFFGLKFLGLIEVPLLDRVLRADDRRIAGGSGAMNATLMGVLFAAGWSPCVGPVLGSVLTYTASMTSEPLVGALYLASYGVGFAVPLLITAAFAEVGVRWLRRLQPHLHKLERVTGALLVVVAATMLLDFQLTLQSTPVFAASSTAAAGPMVLTLYSSDCPICREMKPVIDAVAAECASDDLAFRAIDINDPVNRNLIDRYRLVGVPTFLFLDTDQNEVARLVGRQSEQALHQALSAVRGESCTDVGTLPTDDSVAKSNHGSSEESACLSTFVADEAGEPTASACSVTSP